MTKPAPYALQFESASQGRELLRHFDVEQGCWRLALTGPFWDAVALAHAEGRKGTGRRIAVIDGAFDLTMGGLRERAGGAPRLAAPAGTDTAHGTAVALLIAAVAPAARLDLYEVAVDGRPSEELILQALRESVANGVDVINLSIGHQMAVDAIDTHQCRLRKAVEEATSQGAVILASCGNYADALGCPAQSRGALAVGLRTERRTVIELEGGGQTEVAAWQRPAQYSQSSGADITFSQPPGVFGSSFAAPLAAGLAALADEPSEITCFHDSGKAAANANDLDEKFGTGTSSEARQWHLLIEELYQDAVKALPHPVSMQGSRCPLCAVLAHWILVNAGRFQLSRNLLAAGDLLERAVWLAPWSADAVANLGKLTEIRSGLLLGTSGSKSEAGALLSQAEALYVRALRLKPDCTVYEGELGRIRALAASL